ncbi:hypothetical protein HanIR_Chr01g0016381 [Helianthus annuus]|nr:hypothetical protein HanIR_Chr01g0016381 [Helianthus annuus]
MPAFSSVPIFNSRVCMQAKQDWLIVSPIRETLPSVEILYYGQCFSPTNLSLREISEELSKKAFVAKQDQHISPIKKEQKTNTSRNKVGQRGKLGTCGALQLIEMKYIFEVDDYESQAKDKWKWIHLHGAKVDPNETAN